MHIEEFLSGLESHLVNQLGRLDVKAHPSSDGPRRLTRKWTIDFIAAEAARHSEYLNLAVLLRNVNEPAPEM